MDYKRTRFSLKNMLLVFAFVGTAMIVVLQWLELGPLRAEVRQMRTQLGFLSIDDDSRAQSIQVRQPDANVWRWRIYLPPNGKYKLVEVGGLLPGRAGKSDQVWLHDVENAQYGAGRGEFTSKELQGEFTLEASLSRQDKGWRFATEPGGGESIYPFKSDWLADAGRIAGSGISKDVQRVFKPGKPVILLYLAKPIFTPAIGGGIRSTLPTDTAEGIVLWLEQQPSGTAPAGKP